MVKHSIADLDDQEVAELSRLLEDIRARREPADADSAIVPPDATAADIECMLRDPTVIERIARAGKRWLEINRAALADLPRGTHVATNIDTGAFVIASDGVEAMDKFQETFGPAAIAWVHEVGVPLTIGGGLWALRSEA